MDPIIIPVEVDLEGLQVFENELPAAAKKGARAVGDAFGKEIPKATAKSQKAVRDLGKDMDQFASLGGKVAKIPIPGFQALGETVDVVGQSASALLSPVGLAVVAVGGMVAVGAAAAVGMFKLGTAVADLVGDYESLLDAVAPFKDADGMGISSEALASLKSANQAMDAFEATAAAVKLEIATQLAPTVRETSVLFVAMGLAIKSVFKDNAVEGSAFESVLRGIAKATFEFAVGPLGATLAGLKLLAQLTGRDVPAGLDTAIERLDALGKTFQEKVVDKAADGLKDLEEAGQPFLDQAEALLGAYSKLPVVLTAAGEAFEVLPFNTKTWLADLESASDTLQGIYQDTLVQAMTPLEQIEASYMAQIRQVEELAAQTGLWNEAGITVELLLQAMARDMAALEVETVAVTEATTRWDAALAQTDLSAAGIGATFGHVGKGITDMVDAVGAVIPSIGDAMEEQGSRAFKAMKAFAVGQVIIQGAIAAATAVAQLGPIAGPIAAVGIVGSTVAGALVAVRGATPEYAMGGMVSAADLNPQNRVPALLEPGEGVLNPRAVDAVGGPDGLEALNAGGRSGGASVVQILFNGRVLDTMVSEVLGGRGSAASTVRAMTTGRGRVSMLG